MENSKDMRQYLDPQFIYVAEIRARENGNYVFRRAYGVSKDTLRHYAKWIAADKFTLSDIYEISDGALSKEALQFDACESITKAELRDFLGGEKSFLPGELAIAKDDNKYAITTNGWQGVVLAVIRRNDTSDNDLLVQDVEGSDIPYIVEQSAFRKPTELERPYKTMYDAFCALFPNQQEEILKTTGLRHWAEANELKFTYEDAQQCIAECYKDADYMHSEYSDVYSDNGDMTFIMRYDYYHLDGTVDTNVCGFYYGEPNEEDDEQYRDTIPTATKEE